LGRKKFGERRKKKEMNLVTKAIVCLARDCKKGADDLADEEGKVLWPKTSISRNWGKRGDQDWDSFSFGEIGRLCLISPKKQERVSGGNENTYTNIKKLNKGGNPEKRFECREK